MSSQPSIRDGPCKERFIRAWNTVFDLFDLPQTFGEVNRGILQIRVTASNTYIGNVP